MPPARRFAALLFLIAAAGLCGPVTAQPDEAALEKAKIRFEADSAKAEEALFASLDKALAKAKAAGNKAMVEKLTYEKDLFATQRIVPSAVPGAAYLRQRISAQDALELAYRTAMKDHLKNKNDAEAEALEKELNAIVKATRGYGIAFPDLENKTQVLIENKASGTVLESVKLNTSGTLERVQLAPKVGKKNPAQCWTIEREEKGIVFHNVATGRAISMLKSITDGYVLNTSKTDPTKETPERFLFKCTETRHEITIASQLTTFSNQFLGVSEKKFKGVTSYDLMFSPGKSPEPSTHLWVLTEAK